MELALAILMVLGIFVGIPAVIGFAIVGVFFLREQRIRRIERAKAVGEAQATADKQAKEHAQVA